MKIKKIMYDRIIFENGSEIVSEHFSDCCESHYVDFTSLQHQGAENADFPESLMEMVVRNSHKEEEVDYSSDSWRSFIQIKDKKGFIYTLTIYNSNNGYYATDVSLVHTNKHYKGYKEVYKVQS